MQNLFQLTARWKNDARAHPKSSAKDSALLFSEQFSLGLQCAPYESLPASLAASAMCLEVWDGIVSQLLSTKAESLFQPQIKCLELLEIATVIEWKQSENKPFRIFSRIKEERRQQQQQQNKRLSCLHVQRGGCLAWRAVLVVWCDWIEMPKWGIILQQRWPLSKDSQQSPPAYVTFLRVIYSL